MFDGKATCSMLDDGYGFQQSLKPGRRANFYHVAKHRGHVADPTQMFWPQPSGVAWRGAAQDPSVPEVRLFAGFPADPARTNP